jgi:hypothetical protein
MTARPVVLAAAAASALLFGLVLRGQALAAARDRADVQLVTLASIEKDLERIAALRSQQDVVATAKRPPQDVIALVNAVLRESGVPTDRFKNLEPESDVPTSGGLRRQTLRLVLEQITVAQLGAFLFEWTARQQLWTPTGIELTHRAAGNDTDDRFDARVVLAATYFSDAHEEPTR